MLYHWVMKRKLVRGIGIYEKGLYQTTSKEYQIWDSMLSRCQTGGAHQARMPSYKGCTVHPDFIKFQEFAEWCQNQHGFGQPKHSLDKDILIPGNKVYGPDTCVFVPQRINSLLTHNQSDRGVYPVGVCLYQPTDGHNPLKPFKSAIAIDGKTKHLGYYDTPEAAHAAYKVAKEAEVRRQALNHVDSIDPRVFAALMSYEVK